MSAKDCLTPFGDKLEIERGGDENPFKYYVKRYHNGGICTLVHGCKNEIEVVKVISKILEEEVKYEDYI